MPYLQETGTSLLSDRVPQGQMPRHGKARGPPSRSESECGSSTDSQPSPMSSQAAMSPHTIQEEPPGVDSQGPSGSGLQLSIKPPSTPRGTKQQQTPLSTMSGVSPMPNNSYQPYSSAQNWGLPASGSNAQGPYMGASQNSKLSGPPGAGQMPPGYHAQHNPGPMARRYSDAITRRHLHSMSDPQFSAAAAAQRPHTSISVGNPYSKQGLHHHSMSVPNTAILLSQGSPQLMMTRTSESSPTQAGFITELLHEQGAYHPPGAHRHVPIPQYPEYSSSSSSNVGLSFSPISQSASFSSIDHAAEYSTSSASASYFSALSLQSGSQPTMPQESHLLLPSDPTLMASEPVSDPWADMMPSMGVTTPSQELSSSSGKQRFWTEPNLSHVMSFLIKDDNHNISGSTPQATDRPAYRASHPGSPFMPEQGVFGMNGLDLETEFNFTTFNPS